MELQVFESTEFGKVRAVELNGEPWFVGKDVADILGYTNSRKALIDHADGHTSINKTPKVTGKGQIYFVNKFLSMQEAHTA